MLEEEAQPQAHWVNNSPPYFWCLSPSGSRPWRKCCKIMMHNILDNENHRYIMIWVWVVAILGRLRSTTKQKQCVLKNADFGSKKTATHLILCFQKTIFHEYWLNLWLHKVTSIEITKTLISFCKVCTCTSLFQYYASWYFLSKENVVFSTSLHLFDIKSYLHSR